MNPACHPLFGKAIKGYVVKWVGPGSHPVRRARKEQGFEVGDMVLVIGQSVNDLEVLHKGTPRYIHITEIEKI